jgi:hypothetical protein
MGELILWLMAIVGGGLYAVWEHRRLVKKMAENTSDDPNYFEVD